MTIRLPPDDAPDYLWDGQGEPDPDVLAVQSALAPLAWRAQPLQPRVLEAGAAALSARTRRRRFGRVAAALAASLFLSVGMAEGLRHRLQWPQDQAWRISEVVGAPQVQGVRQGEEDRLAPGQWLATGADARVHLRAARIGEVVIGEHSRFRIVQTRTGRHRTQLQQGVLWARVWAPPGQFGVATPRGDVIDLGCEFVLRAQPDGSGSVTVSSGWVQWDNGWSEVLVPQGARLDIAAGGRPGTPYDLRSSAAFRQALKAVDATRRIQPRDPRIDALVAQAQPQDALSLLVLLRQHPQLLDGPVYERLVQLMPADAQLTREQIRREGPRAYNLWWEQLPYPRTKRWWLHWADALPASGSADKMLDADAP
ncbi:FecR domain-containing protein [Pseudoxanthomonas indica]|uniref:FecR protein domain-containing protein n=1 Tax=Pseudoxanthomonas indica TaxID=428993 RepID=A0A1T5JVM9_9GAMM|nr:FecR domain-containing protein [Pseudoxanthomonas indica]GGD44691.1 hypothetical protein GCM10007235_15830 [Pseudoxanthomonas indica]SKC55441.1 hypothetical protein SAMN06296058_1124 [Pseudoxanthomonas indica]